MVIIGLYLGAIVAANLLVAQFGAEISILNAFLFIGLDLTARDSLHERWHHHNLWLKMLVLIGTGSLLSALLNVSAGRIAGASFAAFLVNGMVDLIVYTLLYRRSKFVKMNGSNLFSAAADSLVFPILAFGFPPLWGIVAGQFIMKVLGGFVWFWIFRRMKII